MKPGSENKLDQIFREGVSQPAGQNAYQERDWKAMENLLDGNPGKRGPIRRLSVWASGIAALLLLSLGWLFYNNDKEEVTKPNKNKREIVHSSTIPGKSGHDGQLARDPAPTPSADRKTYAVNNSIKSRGKSFFSLSAAQSGRQITGVKKAQPLNGIADTIGQNITIAAVQTPATAALQTELIAATPTIAAQTPAVSDTPAGIDQQQKSNKPKLKSLKPGMSRLSLALVAAPDVNGVGSFNRAQVGTTYGLLLTYNITPKLSVTSGAAYAVKPYTANFSDYKTSYYFKTQPTDVSANCKVLDIPLNINYQLLTKGKNSFSIGSGLSSYLMLRERYVYNYTGKYSYGPADYSVSNQNQHWFGVLNINAAYQRQLSPKVSAIVQPYLKLPFNGIGAGQVNLQTAGVALGVNWNIGSSLKPK